MYNDSTAGVPKAGRVSELISGVDIYPIMGKLAGFSFDESRIDGNLPEIFGGKAREYVYSNSIYPGQTYKLSIRSQEHEFRLESKEFTREDGTVDLTDYTYKLFTRDEAHKPVYSDELNHKFLRLAFEYTKSFAEW